MGSAYIIANIQILFILSDTVFDKILFKKINDLLNEESDLNAC